MFRSFSPTMAFQKMRSISFSKGLSCSLVLQNKFVSFLRQMKGVSYAENFLTLPNRRSYCINCNTRLSKHLSPLVIKNQRVCIINVRNSSSDGRMKAWQIQRYGDLNELHLVSRDIPEIKDPDDVLIKVYAASLNPIDLRVMAGYGSPILNRARNITKAGEEFPLTLGRDCSGIVVKVGDNVKEFKEGDEVWAALEAYRPGLHAEYAVVKTNEMSLKPKNLKHIHAASLPYVAITTWTALCEAVRVTPQSVKGKRAVVFGGSGGVGTFAIQLLRGWGAIVTTTCSSDAFELVDKCGANRIVDYASSNLEDKLKIEGNYNIILNTVGPSMDDIAIKLLASKSKYVSIVNPLLQTMDQGAKSSTLAGMTLLKTMFKFMKVGATYRWSFAKSNQQALNHVKDMAEKEIIKPVLDGEVYPFENLPLGFSKLRNGHMRGKIVIQLEEEKHSLADSLASYESVWSDIKD